MAPEGTFRCEIEKADSDESGNKVTTVRCYGRLIAGICDQLKDVVKPLIPGGGRIVIDLGELNYLDSAGLGTLLSLKISALKQGYCRLELANMAPRILELLRITHTDTVFSS